MYQETELCVVYINGEYWGHYNIRERINKSSMICQYEGWEGQEDDIDLVKANDRVMQRLQSDSFADHARLRARNNGVPNDETLARVGEERRPGQLTSTTTRLEIFVGNADTLNVKRYRNHNADGKWRWTVCSTWTGRFYVDTNSIRRWLNPDGVGTDLKTDNTLFVELMKNPERAGSLPDHSGQPHGYELLHRKCALPRSTSATTCLSPRWKWHQARWGLSMATWEKEVERLREYARTRPGLLLGYIQDYYKFSNEEMRRYFGEAMDKAGYTGA